MIEVQTFTKLYSNSMTVNDLLYSFQNLTSFSSLKNHQYQGISWGKGYHIKGVVTHGSAKDGSNRKNTTPL